MYVSRPNGPSKRRLEYVDSTSLMKRGKLIKQLLDNRIKLDDLIELRSEINPEELSVIIQRIYDLNESHILKLSTVDGILRLLNQLKNANRNAAFDRKIKGGFREVGNPDRKVILVEGDSWFNYPVILTDLIDRICMEKNFAVYSIAGGGDWLLNMLTAREYIQELSLLYPDVFLISGGGNDLVGSRRLAAIIEPSGKSDEFKQCEFANELIKNADTEFVKFDPKRFENGSRYLSKDFFALLMFFHLQYYYLINGMVGEKGKFTKTKIITQGYDYAVPSSKKGFGPNPMHWYVPFVRSFLGHSAWLKTPMQMRGISDKDDAQRDIIYSMIYLFNEVMIGIGKLFNEPTRNRVFHIDCRGLITNDDEWADELHVTPKYAMKIGEEFVRCINGEENAGRSVYVVNPKKNS